MRARGKQVWTFHTIPTAADDPITATWSNESWKVTGHANVWAPFTVDVERGLVYLPVSTPSNDYYGVHRLGRQLVCRLDRVSRRRNGRAQVAFSGRPSRSLGLRSAGRARARDDPRRRPPDRRRRAGHEAGLRLRVRSRHRRTRLARSRSALCRRATFPARRPRRRSLFRRSLAR